MCLLYYKIFELFVVNHEIVFYKYFEYIDIVKKN